MLVDRIIGQVHIQVVHVTSVGLTIWLCGKPRDAFFVDVDSQRVNAVEQHVNAEVVLEILDQVWLVQVLLNDEAHVLF